MLGRTVLLTGASGGIGEAIATKFALLGCNVALFGRNEAKLQEVKASLSVAALNQSHGVFVCDVTNEAQIESSVTKVVQDFGGIDILVNNAGVLIGSPIQSTSNDTFDTNMNVNTRGPFLMMRSCIPHLKARKGNIVNVSSVTGMQSFANSMAYCVSKAALDMMTKCAAIDLAADGVRVNSVNPGVIRSELQKRGGMSDENYEKFLERSKVTHPLGRIGEPSEVAELVSFLADNSRSGFMTGAVCPIDGGRVCLGAR